MNVKNGLRLRCYLKFYLCSSSTISNLSVDGLASYRTIGVSHLDTHALINDFISSFIFHPKIIPVFDAMVRLYESDPEFKKQVDEIKASL